MPRTVRCGVCYTAIMRVSWRTYSLRNVMTKRFLPLLLALVLMGAGCNFAADSGPDISLAEIEAEYNLDLPDDSVVDTYTPIPSYHFVLLETDASWDEVRDTLHEQLIAQGFEDTISIKNATEPSSDNPIIGSYLKSTGEAGPAGIVKRALVIEIENGVTRYSILK